MPQQLLNRPDVLTILQQMSREGVAKGMASNFLVQFYQCGRFLHYLLNRILMQMVTPPLLVDLIQPPCMLLV